MRPTLILLAAMTLSACSHVDTGQIDYRVADRPPQTQSACREGAECRDRYAVGLHRRYAPSDNASDRPFEPADVYSIEIEQAMIGNNILEGVILGRQIGRSAEIAILANVFEFGANETEAAQRRFLQSGEFDSKSEDPSDVELKLIYYGDDVRRGQPLNFSNIPLKPRSAYRGGSVGIQLVVMEVDAQSGPVSSLLTTLARFGQKAVPVSSEVSDILFDLGESLFTGSSGGDDRLFEYRFVLSAVGSDPDAIQATFAPGRYVLRRGQDRVPPQEWDKVRLDLNTGRLVDQAGIEVRNEFYMVLNVRKYPEGTPAEFYAFDNWPAFRSAIQAQVDDRTKPIDKVTEAVNQSLRERRSGEWRTQLMAKWATAEGRLRAFTARQVNRADNVGFSECAAALATADQRSQEAERNARDALRMFLVDYQLATRAPAEGEGQEFSMADREALVSRIARYFMPWSGDMESHFADAGSFDSFAKDNAGGLLVTALATARAAGRTARGCDDIR